MIFSFTLWNSCRSMACSISSSSLEKWAMPCSSQISANHRGVATNRAKCARATWPNRRRRSASFPRKPQREPGGGDADEWHCAGRRLGSGFGDRELTEASVGCLTFVGTGRAQASPDRNNRHLKIYWAGLTGKPGRLRLTSVR